MHTMTEAEYKAFLLMGTRTAKVATVRVNGLPHVKPVWITRDGDDILFTTHESYVMTKHLRRDPHVSLVVDDETPGEYLVRVTLGKVIAQAGIADYAIMMSYRC